MNAFREKRKIGLAMDLVLKVEKKDLLEQQTRLADSLENVFYLQGNFSDFYRELDILGEGCVGVVRRVERVSDGAVFASKMVRTKDEAEVVRNVIREFKNQRRLRHSNIVQVYELYVDETRGRIYSIMELVHATEMFETIATLGHYSERVAATIFKQILLAIDYLHDRRICHRDLKPNNILCDPTGSLVKITDFNVSKFAHTENEHKKAAATPDKRSIRKQSLTHGEPAFEYEFPQEMHELECEEQKHVLMWTYTGTVAFSAPEVFAGDSYDESIDMWSAGAVLYTMLAGYQPFEEEYVQDLIEKISKADFTFPDEPFRNISASAKDLIAACLRVDPKQRISPKQALQHPWITEDSLVNRSTELCAPKIISRNLNKFVSKFAALRNLGLIRKPVQRKRTFCTSILYKTTNQSKQQQYRGVPRINLNSKSIDANSNSSFSFATQAEQCMTTTTAATMDTTINTAVDLLTESESTNLFLTTSTAITTAAATANAFSNNSFTNSMTDITSSQFDEELFEQTHNKYLHGQQQQQQLPPLQSVQLQQEKQISYQSEAGLKSETVLQSKYRQKSYGAKTNIIHNRYQLNESDQLFLQTLEDDTSSDAPHSFGISQDLSDTDQILCEKIFSKIQLDPQQFLPTSFSQLQCLTAESDIQALSFQGVTANPITTSVISNETKADQIDVSCCLLNQNLEKQTPNNQSKILQNNLQLLTPPPIINRKKVIEYKRSPYYNSIPATVESAICMN